MSLLEQIPGSLAGVQVLYVPNYSSTKSYSIARICKKTEDSLQEILQSLFGCATAPVCEISQLL